MRILELFSGSGVISKAFRERGDVTLTVDYNASFNPDIVADVLNLDIKILQEFAPDIVWASPPCTTFSVASIGAHWTGGSGAYIPKSEEAQIGIALAKKTLEIIQVLKPKHYFIENPRGVLRKMDFMADIPRYTVTYCQYGDRRMKPTDIWTNYVNPPFKPICKNGDLCHEKAPRGSRTGTQGLKGAYERGIIPEELCKAIVDMTHNDCQKINIYHARQLSFMS